MINEGDSSYNVRTFQSFIVAIRKMGALRSMLFFLFPAVAIYFLFGYLADVDPIRSALRICKSGEPQNFLPVEEVFGGDVTRVCILSRREYSTFLPFDKGGDKKPAYMPPSISDLDYYVLYSEYSTGRKNIEYLLMHELASKSGKQYTSFSPGYQLDGMPPCWNEKTMLKLSCGSERTVSVYFQKGE